MKLKEARREEAGLIGKRAEKKKGKRNLSLKCIMGGWLSLWWPTIKIQTLKLRVKACKAAVLFFTSSS